MTIPKITGLLNNCTMNCALPILLKKINELASREQQGTLDEIRPMLWCKSLERLKDIFAQYYGVISVNFSWEVFARFLNAHSFYANEIMFAPVFRNFIVERAPELGYTDLSKLRDVQADGRYEMLAAQEVDKLFYSAFGISVQVYELTESVEPIFETNLPKSIAQLSLYLDGSHYEIQPSESLGEATTVFTKEINALPPLLNRIHDGLSTSISASNSNRYLAYLHLYVSPMLVQTFAPRRSSAEDLAALTADVLVTAQEHAILGRESYLETPAGNFEFAITLLSMRHEEGDLRADHIYKTLEDLSLLERGDAPLASYFKNKLTKAVIDSQAILSNQKITDVLFAIEKDQRLTFDMTRFEQMGQGGKAKLVPAARHVIREAWKAYKEKKNEDFIDVIQKTQALVGRPTKIRLAQYRKLQQNIEGEGSYGKIISGLMLSFLGLVLVAGTVLGLVGTAGMALPWAMGGFAGGVSLVGVGCGFFAAGRDTGLYKDMKQLGCIAERMRPGI